jgi:hypothetical protein
MFCRNKKFCNVKSRILYICRNTKFGQYWLSTRYFLGDFNETQIHIIFPCPSTNVPSLVEKYPKIKYANKRMDEG